MSGLNVRSAFGKLQDILFTKDLRRETFVTGQKMGSSRRGLDTIALAIYNVADDIVEAGSTNNLVKLTAHQAREGDFLQITSSANGITEFEVSIDEIIDADHFTLGAILSASLAAGDTVSILRPITPRMSSTGATLTTVSPSPVIFKKNGLNVEVVEDTATPANNQPLPVKLTGVTGDLNITAQDLNIQSSHLGANPDSMRVGDGVTELGIEPVTKKALVKDASAIAELQNILTELELKADLSETQPISAANLPLPSGAATSALQGTANTSLATLAAKDFATQATLAALLVELQLKADLAETQPISAANLPLPSGAATSALQGTTNTSLATIAGKDFATQTTLALMKTALDSVLTGEGAIADVAVTNPASSGSMIALLKGLLTLITLTNTKLDIIDNNTSGALNSVSNTTATTNTLLSAPANAIGMIVQNSTNADSAIRFCNSGNTPTAGNGFFLGPGQSTSYMPAASIRTVSVDGGAPDISVIWFV